MSWDVSLECRCCGGLVKVERHEGGGTYRVGSTEAQLSVTYNYSDQFDFGSLDGVSAGFTIRTLREARDRLGTEPDPDYWKSTPGNAGRAVETLLGWAEDYPDAIWRVE